MCHFIAIGSLSVKQPALRRSTCRAAAALNLPTEQAGASSPQTSTSHELTNLFPERTQTGKRQKERRAWAAVDRSDLDSRCFCLGKHSLDRGGTTPRPRRNMVDSTIPLRCCGVTQKNPRVDRCNILDGAAGAGACSCACQGRRCARGARSSNRHESSPPPCRGGTKWRGSVPCRRRRIFRATAKAAARFSCRGRWRVLLRAPRIQRQPLTRTTACIYFIQATHGHVQG